MRNLFDTRKEHKSLKLVKKLQEQADLEWEKEVERRREQELNDEAIAKELQAELEDEQRRISNNNSPFTTNQSNSSIPPPLPTKPRAYNSSNTLTTTSPKNDSRPSSHSLPTAGSSASITPLYGLKDTNPSLPPRQSTPANKPKKSYLPSQTYKPELHFALASPSPSPNSVFYQNTPVLSPTTTKPISIASSQTNQSNSNTSSSNHSQFYNNNSSGSSSIMMLRPVSNTPAPLVEPPIMVNKMSMPEPADTVPTSYTPAPATSAPSSYNRQSTPISRPPVNTNFNHHNQSDPIVPQSYGTPAPTIPIVTPYSEHNAPLNNANQQTPLHYNDNSYPPRREATPISLPLSTNEILQNVFTQQPNPSNNNSLPTYQQHQTPANNFKSLPTTTHQTPAPIFASATMPLNKQQQQMSSTNPYYKKQQQQQQKQKQLYSNSVLSLKPDEDQQVPVTAEEEEEDDWDNEPIKRVHTPPVPSMAVSDNESEYDYSDMIYDRRKEDEEEEPAPLIEESDPFADSFAVEVPKPSMLTTLEPTIQILDPTILSRKLSTKIAVEEGKKDKAVPAKITPNEEKIAAQENDEKTARTYEEKESEEIEVRPTTPFTGFKTPVQHARAQSLGTGILTEATITPRPPYVNHSQQQSSPAFFTPPPPPQETEDEENTKVFPTNILKAGPPVIMSENNPYSKKQGAVPSSDYGYYDPLKTKTLPKLPNKTSSEDRHITVASINPGQRVWIRIHPTDTGKMLAERIHIVASYQTRKVTKITTKHGRNIALDNSPLFDDWNEIINFKEGEAWTVEWVPIEHPYVDIITEGKEFMKQLKANFKGSSSS